MKLQTRLYPGVALLDEHQLTDEDGEVTFSVDAEFLEEVAQNGNRRVALTGDRTPLVLGHTRDGVDEQAQPKIVGWAENFRVQKFAKTGRKALFADLHIYQDQADLVERQYPRRSVELWVNRKEIDPISLLGATTPERDLGPLVRFSRGGDQLYRYSLTSSERPMPDPMTDAAQGETSQFKALEAKVDKLVSMFEQFLSAVMQGEEAPGGEDDLLGPADEEAMGDEMEMKPEAEEEGEEEEKAPAKDAAKFHEPPPVKMQAGPSAGTGYTPNLDETKKMSRSDENVLKLQRQAQAQEKQIKELQLKLSRADAKETIAQLKAEGYEFADESEDLEIFAQLGTSTPEGKKHAERIKRNYRRSAIGLSETGLLAEAQANTGLQTLTLEQARQAAYQAAAAKKPESYQEALGKLYSKK